MAKVLSANTSNAHGIQKRPAAGGVRLTELGLDGDAHSGDWQRQVSLLDRTSIDELSQSVGKKYKPGDLSENITTEGIALHKLAVGTRLLIGDVILHVTQIGSQPREDKKPDLDEAARAIASKRVYARVLKPGVIKPGDEISIIPAIRTAIITISDRGFTGTHEDKSGPALVSVLLTRVYVDTTLIIPDEYDRIKETLVDLCDSGNYDMILTTGGTGFAPRDVTPEATLAAVERLTPGICEAIRRETAQYTPRAMLSRAVAGIRGKTLIVNLPGSPKAAVECISVFLPVMQHAIETLRGISFDYGQH